MPDDKDTPAAFPPPDGQAPPPKEVAEKYTYGGDYLEQLKRANPAPQAPPPKPLDSTN